MWNGYDHHWERDSWDDRHWHSTPSPLPHARQSRHAYHHSSHHLSPEPQYSNLHRSRSQGHNTGHPTNIYIKNDIPITQDTSTAQRNDSRPPPMAAPMQAPMPPQQQQHFHHVPMMQPQPPVFVPMMAHPPMVDFEAERARRYHDQLMAEDLARMRLHSRSRSRGRSMGDDNGAARTQWELEQRKRELEAAETKRRQDEEIAALKTQFELDRRREADAVAAAKKLREEEAAALKLKLELEATQAAAKRRKEEEDTAAERARIISDHERKVADDARKAKEAEAEFKRRLEQQAQEEREREQRAYDDYMNKKKAREAEEERLYKEYLARQKEKEEAEERKYQAFLRKQKEKQEAEEKAKKDEQAKLDAEMKARLEKAGWSAWEIELALDPEKAEKERKRLLKEMKKQKHHHGDSPHHLGNSNGDIVIVPPAPEAPPAVPAAGHVPVYPRIHRKYLDIHTLEHYHVPWELDRANQDYIILLREMDKYHTEVLFEHTRRNRQNKKGPLLLDKSKDSAPKFAWVRKKSGERSKSRGRDIRVTEIRRL